MAELMTATASCGLEPKVLRLVYPKTGRAPELLLMECTKGAAPGLKVEKPFILYDNDGKETDDFSAVHRF